MVHIRKHLGNGSRVMILALTELFGNLFYREVTLDTKNAEEMAPKAQTLLLWMWVKCDVGVSSVYCDYL